MSTSTTRTIETISAELRAAGAEGNTSRADALAEELAGALVAGEPLAGVAERPRILRPSA